MVPEEDWAFLDSATDADEIAAEMVVTRLRQNGVRADASSIEVLRVVNARHFRWTRSRNLRELAWRLDSWDPAKKSLSEVDDEDVRHHVRAKLLIPAQPNVGSLERVAALAQWETRFERITGDNLEGLDDLVRKNIVYCVDPELSWSMDPTDAYLCLATIHKQNWLPESIYLLRKNMPSSPAGRSALAWGILLHSDRDIRMELFAELDLDLNLMLALSSQLKLGTSAAGEFLSAKKLFDLLLKDLPVEKSARESRLNAVRALCDDKLLDDLGTAFRSANLIQGMWMLTFLVRGLPELQDRLAYLVHAVGEDEWRRMIGSHRSAVVQQRVLTLLRRIDPDFAYKVRKGTTLLPVPMHRQRFAVLEHLANATVVWGEPRRLQVDFLNQLDPDELPTMFEHGAKTVQRFNWFLNSSFWLSPDAARRFATRWPEVLRLNSEEPKSLVGISRVLNEVVTLAPDSASSLITELCEIPYSRLVQACSRDEVAFLLTGLDKATPGAADGYVSRNREELCDDCERNAELWRSMLPTVFGVLSEGNRGALFESFTRNRAASLVDDPFDAWVWAGAAAISNHRPRQGVGMALPSIEKLSESRNVKLILALHGLASNGRSDYVAEVLRQLSQAPTVGGTLPSIVARHSAQWTTETVLSILRDITASGMDLRQSGIRKTVLAVNACGVIEWPRKFAFRPTGRGSDAHRAIQAALASRLLRIKSEKMASRVRVGLDKNHSLAIPTIEASGAAMHPLNARYFVPYAEWSSGIQKAFSAREKVYWLSKMIEVGSVEWRVQGRSNDLTVEFRKREATALRYAYNVLQLPLPAP